MDPRRKLLTVIIRDVPPPTPRVGEEVWVILNGVPEDAVRGRVYQALGYGTLRVEILGMLPDD
jgi:hypothetical protein